MFCSGLFLLFFSRLVYLEHTFKALTHRVSGETQVVFWFKFRVGIFMCWTSNASLPGLDKTKQKKKHFSVYFIYYTFPLLLITVATCKWEFCWYLHVKNNKYKASVYSQGARWQQVCLLWTRAERYFRSVLLPLNWARLLFLNNNKKSVF